ncbi:hypothetical protein BTVI_126423 [Pitangus sulphuratus]|nr:hypothetical protein BTVI_126423 [Pitangus sulphuratus]
MLRRAGLAVCPPWEPARGRGLPGGSSPPPLLKGAEPRRGGSRSRWPPGRRGRVPGGARKLLGSRTHSHFQHQQLQLQQQHCRAFRRCQRPARPRVLLSLRPVNVLGRRAPGMRAPRNTNQFLMREKYQLMHLRSDSVGTESGGSDCEMDPLDMDSYLGVLENARGALMECAGQPGPAARSPPARAGAEGSPQEESQQYFPSEDDVIESELFMERDFHEFCSRIA